MRIQLRMCLVVFVHGGLEHVLLIVAQEDHIQMVVVLDALDPVCVYIDFCSNQNADNRF